MAHITDDNDNLVKVPESLVGGGRDFYDQITKLNVSATRMQMLSVQDRQRNLLVDAAAKLRLALAMGVISRAEVDALLSEEAVAVVSQTLKVL